MSYLSKLCSKRKLRRFQKFRARLIIEFLRNPNSNPSNVSEFFIFVDQEFNNSKNDNKEIEIPNIVFWNTSLENDANN